MPPIRTLAFLGAALLATSVTPARAQSAALPYIFTTLAGSTAGTSGYLDATGTDARFARPWGLTIDPAGNLYVAEIANHTIRKVTPTGVVTTIAGRPGIAGWADGPAATALLGGSTATPPSTSAASVAPTGPFSLSRDATGNLFVADTIYNVIRQITPTGTVSTIAGTPLIGGHLDGALSISQFRVPFGVTSLADDSLLVADTFNHVIRKISRTGTVTTVAGTPGTPGSRDGAGPQALFLHPCAVVAGPDGILYVTEANNLVRRLTPTSGASPYTVTTIAGTALAGGSVDGQGANARFGAAAETLLGVSYPFTQGPGNGGPSGGSVAIYAVGGLTGVALAPDGNLIIADYYNHTIRQVTPAGLVTTIGGKAVTRGRVDGIGTAATFSSPAGVAIDSAGNLYIADSLNNTIRKGTRAAVPAFPAGTATLFVAAGATRVLTATATGFPTPAYQWLKDGIAVPGATSGSLTLTDISKANAGTYTVIATNSYGTTTGAATVVQLVAPPVITRPPAGGTLVPGEPFVLSVAADTAIETTYQWYRDGAPVAGARSATLTLTSSEPARAGSYTVTVTNAAGSVTSSAAVVTLASSKIINLSVRTALSPGQTLTVGFVVNGTEKPLLIRAVGPTLRAFGLSTAVADPLLFISSPAGTVASNDNWSETASSSQIATVAQSVGAFALPVGSLDSTVFTTVGNAALTAQAVEKTFGSGVVLLELYDAAPANSARLINVSTRSTAASGDNALVAGFVISGNAPRKVLLRAVGPTLGSFGVPGTLADPKLEVFAAGSTTALATNDNWGGTTALTTAFGAVGAFALPDANSRDAALVLTLDPGSYSAQVTGVGGTTGEVLLEVYEHP